MAFKRSAVRSRLSPPSDGVLGNMFFDLLIEQVFLRHFRALGHLTSFYFSHNTGQGTGSLNLPYKGMILVTPQDAVKHLLTTA